MDTILVPKHKRSPGAPPVVSPVRPSVDAERAARLATYAKAFFTAKGEILARLATKAAIMAMPGI